MVGIMKTAGPSAKLNYVSVGFSPRLLGAVVKWSKEQSSSPETSEAVCSLVEIALAMRSDRKSSDNQKARAKEIAGTTIDRLSERGATDVDKATRKQRLLKGPEEFRESRIDRKKTKIK